MLNDNFRIDAICKCIERKNPRYSISRHIIERNMFSKLLAFTDVCHLDSVLDKQTLRRCRRQRRLVLSSAVFIFESYSISLRFLQPKTKLVGIEKQHRSCSQCSGISKSTNNYKFPLAPLCIRTVQKNWMSKIKICSASWCWCCVRWCSCSMFMYQYRFDIPCTRIRHHRGVCVYVWVCAVPGGK